MRLLVLLLIFCANINAAELVLGTTCSTASSPHIPGDATSGICTAGAAKVDGYISGANIWETTALGNRLNVGIGLGIAPSATYGIHDSFNIAGATTGYGILNDGIVQSAVTAEADYFATSAQTLAASFTVTTLNHYSAKQSTIGASSAVTTQNGFLADATIAGAATNNFGFKGALVASTTKNYNLYMSGTAPNLLTGDTIVTGGTNGCNAVDGACISYGSAIAHFGAGAADAINFNAGTSTTASIDQYGRSRFGILGSVPSITSGACGSTTNGTITAGGNDQNFLLNIGAAVTASCIVNFSTAWTTAPIGCDATPTNAAAAASGTTGMYMSAPTTTTVTMNGSALANTTWSLQCQ
jgi:hypothetical protein